MPHFFPLYFIIDNPEKFCNTIVRHFPLAMYGRKLAIFGAIFTCFPP